MATRTSGYRKQLARWLVGCCILLGACSSGDSEELNVGNEPVTGGAVTAPIRQFNVAYGELPSQFGSLWRPEGSGSETFPVVVLIHGGFWRDAFDLELMTPLANDLFARGYAVWNIEYRRLGEDGGGWPETFDDVAAAVDYLGALEDEYQVDLARVAFVGHSAGGHLALWAAGRNHLDAGERWSGPEVTPVLAVGQAPVSNLTLAAQENASNGATQLLLGGGPNEVSERYRAATPREDIDGELLIVWGTADTNVPVEYAIVGDRSRDAIVQVDGGDHFDVIDPNHELWTVVTDALEQALR